MCTMRNSIGYARETTINVRAEGEGREGEGLGAGKSVFQTPVIKNQSSRNTWYKL